ncbi:MAG: Fe-S cluster assembly protein SufD [Gloeomargarita sp. SKYBB_i_bin120]|nr:Fe-S cluster assembly protein SufD [Gloeomargarita sp. SKYB120]MDW8178475.1 Fe-S cluster assembly protein SufD [Gloeomargarita sp. SKYBB_i_bin120]
MGTETGRGLALLAGRDDKGASDFLAWRDQVLAQVQAPDWPSVDREAWRATDLQPVLDKDWRLAMAVGREAVTLELLPELPARVWRINGQVVDHTMLPAGVTLGEWKDLTAAERERLGAGLPADGLTALNQAAVSQVLVVRAKGEVTEPVHGLHYSRAETTPVLVCPRWVLMVEAGARLTWVEDYASAGATWTNGVSEIFLGPGSQLTHYLIQRESWESAHLLRMAVHQARDSHYTLRVVSAGAFWSRCEPSIYQEGPGATTVLRGLSLVGGRQHSDMHSRIVHDHPQGTSRQLHKCVVAHQGQAVFHGNIRVAAAAQLTDAGQLNLNLLLSPKARVDTRPQLEIQADNVKCTHGATVSDLDPDALFYLQSRGLDRQAARLLLVDGFAQELLQEIPFPTLRQQCQALMRQLIGTEERL